MTHASESQHWYDRDGNAAYDIRGANGNMRPVTLRDARKLNLVPGVSTILKCQDRPGLNRWIQEQVLHAALTLPRLPDEPETAFIERIWVDSKEQGKKAAERGVAIHAAIQGWYEIPRKSTIEDLPYCEGVAKALYEWMPEYSMDAQAERSFSHPDGFGGKADLSGPLLVADFKTTEKPLAGVKTWDEHHQQLAACREGLQIPHARCAIVYVSVSEPGQARVIELSEDELERGWKMFTGLLDFWYAKTGLSRG